MSGRPNITQDVYASLACAKLSTAVRIIRAMFKRPWQRARTCSDPLISCAGPEQLKMSSKAGRERGLQLAMSASLPH